MPANRSYNKLIRKRIFQQFHTEKVILIFKQPKPEIKIKTSSLHIVFLRHINFHVFNLSTGRINEAFHELQKN